MMIVLIIIITLITIKKIVISFFLLRKLKMFFFKRSVLDLRKIIETLKHYTKQVFQETRVFQKDTASKNRSLTEVSKLYTVNKFFFPKNITMDLLDQFWDVQGLLNCQFHNVLSNSLVFREIFLKRKKKFVTRSTFLCASKLSYLSKLYLSLLFFINPFENTLLLFFFLSIVFFVPLPFIFASFLQN